MPAKCTKFLALNLRGLMEKSGIKGFELAIKAGVDAAYISQLLNRKNNGPSLSTLEAIADALNSTVSQLLQDPSLPEAAAGHSIADCARRVHEALLAQEKQKTK